MDNNIEQVNQAITAIASESCVDEAVISDLIFYPEHFIAKLGRFWKHVNNERNSPSRMADRWIKDAIAEYNQFRNDIIKDYDYPIWTAGVPRSTPIDDVIRVHLKHKFILSADIKCFYDHISFSAVQRYMPPSLIFVIKSIYFNANQVGLKRGLQASSAISDIVGERIIDNRIKQMIYKNDFRKDIKYSRYCDDLLFSSQSKARLRDLEAKLRTELAAIGFELNKNKTKLKPTNSSIVLGRRIHNGRIIISKLYRNRARLKYYNALKSFEQCNKTSIDDVRHTLAMIETALGTANYIHRYNNINNTTIEQLKEGRKALLQLLNDKDEQSPFV